MNHHDALKKFGITSQSPAVIVGTDAHAGAGEPITVRSPIDGRVGRTLVTQGNLVGYSEPTLLTTVVKVDPIYVDFEVTEREYLDYQKQIRDRGAPLAIERRIPVEVGLENERGYPHVGVLDFRDNRVDPDTGTLALRGRLPNPDRVLTPGLYARVRVPIGAPSTWRICEAVRPIL